MSERNPRPTRFRERVGDRPRLRRSTLALTFGYLSAVAAGVADAIATRIWAIHHRHVVRELAGADELDRLR